MYIILYGAIMLALSSRLAHKSLPWSSSGCATFETQAKSSQVTKFMFLNLGHLDLNGQSTSTEGHHWAVA